MSADPSALRRAGAWATIGWLARTLDGVAPIAPLKGVLLEMTASPGRAAAMCDVDVLVPEHAYEAAHRAVISAGLTCLARDRDDRARTYTGPVPATVDLHRRLFKTGLFRVSTEGLFARATLDEATYGAPVWVLDPVDVCAHVIGHAVSDRHGRAGRRKPLADLGALMAHHGIEPGALAERLEALGLARAARFLLAETPGFAPVLDALPRDALGDRLARLARRVLRPGRPALVQVGAMHALNASLGRGAASLGSHLIRGAHQRFIDREPPT